MKQIIIISIIVALIFLTLGYFAGTKLAPMLGLVGNGSGNDFQAGWEAAKVKLREFGCGPAADAAIKNLSGTVKEINGEKIILKIKPLEPLADPALDERIVIADSNTKITMIEQKDIKVYQQEIEDFLNKTKAQASNRPSPNQSSAASSDMPEMFNRKPGSISDIKINEILNIVAADNDIKNVKEFQATEIEIQLAASK